MDFIGHLSTDKLAAGDVRTGVAADIIVLQCHEAAALVKILDVKEGGTSDIGNC